MNTTNPSRDTDTTYGFGGGGGGLLLVFENDVLTMSFLTRRSGIGSGAITRMDVRYEMSSGRMG